MRFPHIFFCLALVASASGFAIEVSAAESTTGKPWLATHLDSHPAGKGCRAIFESETIPAAICNFSGTRDLVQDFDVVYTVRSGNGVIVVDGEDQEFDSDSVIYVKARVAHRITASADGRAVAFFSVGPAAKDTPDFHVYRLAEARAFAKPDKNVWTPFHRGQSLVYGLYQLPKALDGDKTLRHPMDEINLVVKGNATFHMDDDETSLTPGSIVWVPHGVGHYFNHLSEDFEVLILFHRPPALNKGG